MEFFAEIENRAASAEFLHELVTIARLPELCESIESVVSTQSQGVGELYCVWGEFQVSCENIRNGVRVALLSCPHALAWTVTVKKNTKPVVVIHCTIDDREAESEFVDSIEQFVSDWAQGLRKALPQGA